MTIRKLSCSGMFVVSSLEMVRYDASINLGDTLMTLLNFYIGLLNVEGDEHKRQVGFLFQDLFANCCLILQLAQDFGQLCWATGVLIV